MTHEEDDEEKKKKGKDKSRIKVSKKGGPKFRRPMKFRG